MKQRASLLTLRILAIALYALLVVPYLILFSSSPS